MDDLFLIAHKVRGEPAFDVAVSQPCPKCAQYEYVEGMIVAESNSGCSECDDEGCWWIVSTSGHRAYPYWTVPMETLGYKFQSDGSVPDLIRPMPPGLPDHYPCNPTRSDPNSGKALLAQLGLTQKVVRRL